MPATATKSRKRAVNVTIDADLVAEAKDVGANISAILERALRDELKVIRSDKWREENREAIESSNAEIERNGLWCDKYRTW